MASWEGFYVCKKEKKIKLMTPAAKPGHLKSIPTSHMVEGGNRQTPASCCNLHACTKALKVRAPPLHDLKDLNSVNVTVYTLACCPCEGNSRLARGFRVQGWLNHGTGSELRWTLMARGVWWWHTIPWAGIPLT